MFYFAKILFLQSTPIRIISTITKYIGNANSAKLHIFRAEKLVKATNKPVTYAIEDSVSGYFHDFITVGKAAKPSLAIAKNIATSGSFVIPQKSKAAPDNKPHK
ncbi:MAG: hypothetical protein UT82_C0029G0009 [Parcubacteria group bacterium GW2011_GWB1_40_14]|nr:MAG: hypothetical protein UT82_C0029G0009 [Parcubacteria group bacterium GW2011_GWB1_40_14]